MENLAEEHYNQKSVEGDELVQDEWDVLDKLDEDEWDVLDVLDEDEWSESEESGEVSETRVVELIENFTLGHYRGYIKLYF